MKDYNEPRGGEGPHGAPSLNIPSEVMEKADAWKDSDLRPLAAVMDRAEEGKSITLALIGGSITMGTVSRGSMDTGIPPVPYAEIFRRWWAERFPRAILTFVNAGIGGTDSYLGTHRAEKDVLRHSPDLVLIEYSVNDEDTDFFAASYNSLIRHILEAPSKPAAMLLFMGQTNRATARRIHAAVGGAYRLPMVSCTDAFNALMDGGVFSAAELSGDEVHPSALGHAVTGEILRRFLDRVCEERGLIRGAPGGKEIAREEDRYPHACVLSSADVSPVNAAGFARGTESEFYPDGWTARDGGEIAFRLSFRRLGILYLKTTDGLSGKAEVLMDGKTLAVLDADFTGGWGNAVSAEEVFASEDAAEHILTVRFAGKGRKFGLLGLMVSG